MIKKLLLKLIWFYQHAISPYKGRSYCNYYPTCSEYGEEGPVFYAEEIVPAQKPEDELVYFN